MIEANIHRTSSVSFKLTNQFNSYAPFEAFFTPDSSHEFSVYPTTGTLEPYDSRDGTSFIVSFTPAEYGKRLVGRLVVQTEEMQWTYDVQGTHPDYQRPDPTSKVTSKLDDKTMIAMATAAEKKRNPKNMMRENIKKQGSGVAKGAAAGSKVGSGRKVVRL